MVALWVSGVFLVRVGAAVGDCTGSVAPVVRTLLKLARSSYWGLLPPAAGILLGLALAHSFHTCSC